MPRRSLLLAGLATLTVLSAASAAPSATGLRGTVVLDPSRPVCIEGRPCTAPAAGVVLRFGRDGRVVALTRVDASGAYRVLLRPGRYVVSFAPRAPRRTISPGTVRVGRGTLARVDFRIDTGLQ